MNIGGTGQLVYKIFKGIREGGLDKMSVKDRDLVYRLIKKQMWGLAIGYIAFRNPDNFGGLDYHKDTEDLKKGEIKFGNVKLPAIAGHTPMILHMQMWATIAKYMEEGEGLPSAHYRAFLEMAGEIPWLNEIERFMESKKSEKAAKNYVGRWAAGRIIPAGVNQIGKYTDPVKRDPESFTDYFKERIPGLRQQLNER
jgi:hypothetical protein